MSLNKFIPDPPEDRIVKGGEEDIRPQTSTK